MTDQQPHTPTTAQVRMDYIQASEGDHVSPEESGPQFDRWLATIETAAEQRGAARGKIEGLREAATSIRDSKFANSVKPPSKKVQVKEADWLDTLADRLEGDDD